MIGSPLGSVTEPVWTAFENELNAIPCLTDAPEVQEWIVTPIPPPAPLTATQLAAIYDARPNHTALRLLHDIQQLHALIFRARQIHGMIGRRQGKVPPDMWEAFGIAVNTEPCLTDPPTQRQQARIDRMTATRKNK
ncbi:hypothetical protein [Paraburkholderia acidisoli]|uniref:Uncharacterized protein n=1 Tax=Paraburkholderia acidisoli TaxID=2571748 RepID=A0A7Z2JII7_9BURK|nr:hypothetical protein [Paraburkholderia acidisoli]QGZ64370.1 hypothetical protein FAZ98_21865 [Paraburkholderia acidisoli]